jgi:hypothetical protein
LSAAARRRYGRHLLLGEIGESGQERLMKAGFRLGPGRDADAYAVAAEYLERAGCLRKDDGQEVRIADRAAVLRFAGSPALRETAAAVAGAFAAVEHLKEVLGIAAARDLPPDLTLRTER